jgi:hypothetical protein
MQKRPLSITIVSWLFIAVGIVALAYHSTHISEAHIVWVLFVRFLAIVAGVGMLFRQNWARWLTAAWIAYHVYLSLHHHAASELIVHALLFITIVVFLFWPSSTAYFRDKNRPPSTPNPAGNAPT